MQEKIQKQREFFRGGKPITLSFRKEALKRLGRTIRAHEEEIYEALRKDLNKSKTEAYMCEIGMTLAELSYMLKHIDGWARKRNVLSPIAQFSSDSFTIREPLWSGTHHVSLELSFYADHRTPDRRDCGRELLCGKAFCVCPCNLCCHLQNPQRMFP